MYKNLKFDISAVFKWFTKVIYSIIRYWAVKKPFTHGIQLGANWESIFHFSQLSFVLVSWYERFSLNCLNTQTCLWAMKTLFYQFGKLIKPFKCTLCCFILSLVAYLNTYKLLCSKHWIHFTLCSLLSMDFTLHPKGPTSFLYEWHCCGSCAFPVVLIHMYDWMFDVRSFLFSSHTSIQQLHLLLNYVLFS